MPNQILNKIVLKENGAQVTYKLGSIFEGYFNSSDGKFYADNAHTIEIDGIAEYIYIDLPNNKLYRYDITDAEFVLIGGGGEGGGLVYVNQLPAPPDIDDYIYGYYAITSDNETVALNFLDENEYFTKVNNNYIPKVGIDVSASDDGVTYKELTSLTLDGTDYEATYEDSTTHVFNNGDVFYYKVGKMSFYAGNKQNQVLYNLSGNGGSGGGSYQAGIGIDITGDVISGDYKAGFNIKIDDDKISTADFVGTQADWDALSPAEQAEYKFVYITDDTTQVTYKPGHTISDGTTEKTQRDGLVFNGFEVTDDSTNEITKIAEIPYTAGDGIDITDKEVSVGDEIPRTWTGTKAEWDAIVDKSPYDGWIININDDIGKGPGPVVDVIESGNMNAVTSNAVSGQINNIDTEITNINASLLTMQRYPCSIKASGQGTVKINLADYISGWGICLFMVSYSSSGYTPLVVLVYKSGTSAYTMTLHSSNLFTVSVSGTTVTFTNTYSGAMQIIGFYQ